MNMPPLDETIFNSMKEHLDLRTIPSIDKTNNASKTSTNINVIHLLFFDIFNKDIICAIVIRPLPSKLLFVNVSATSLASSSTLPGSRITN